MREPSIPGGGGTRVVTPNRVKPTALERARFGTLSGVHRREAVGRQKDEGANEEDVEKKEEEKGEEAGVEKTREGRQHQGGGNFLGARSWTKGARNVRL